MQTKNSQKNFSAVLGMLLTLAVGVLWGFSGACGQFLFTQKGVVSTWLVPVSTAVFGVAWLGNTMTVHDLIGFACILAMVVLLAGTKG